MAQDKNNGMDFASVIESSQKLPSNEQGRDLPDGFPLPKDPKHKFVDTATEDDPIPGAAKFDFKVHRRVFTIFRPWEKCDRCQNAIAGDLVELPETEGDYTCPHTNVKEYQEISDACLAGKLMAGPEQEISRPDGVILVSLKWFEPLRTKKKAQGK